MIRVLQKIDTNLVFWSIFIPIIILVLLAIFPSFDIKLSAIFYHYDDGFKYAHSIIPRFIFDTIPILTMITVISCILYLVISVFCGKNKSRIIAMIYLLITIAIGPGLIVNYILKDHLGRARPCQISDFKGISEFAPALSYTDQCDKNCSFPSGHAAMAYYFTAIAYYLVLLEKSKWNRYFRSVYLSGILFGTIVGITRVVMGGHFVSDVAASCGIVLFINYYIYWMLNKKFKP